MKQYISLLVFIFAFSILRAQDCSTYYPFEEGTQFQLSMYNHKDKLTGVLDYTVKESSGDTATMFYEMHDEKGKLLSSSEYGIMCDEDGVSVDFHSLAAPGVMEQYENMEVDISGTNLVLPNNLQPGQELPDANMLMNISMTPINMKMTVDITNRKVSGREQLTTPAGTFDCLVITFDHDAKMGIRMSGSGKQWLAEDVGMVRQENYNKGGKLQSVMVLTKFEG